MRLVFAGTPEFARVALSALHAAGHELSLVLCQPDRPAGRGLELKSGPVKQFAAAHRIAIGQPRGLRLDGKYAEDAAAACAQLTAAAPDAMVVAAYGLILPQWVLDLPRLGCINLHASLLPRWRGAAPIQRALEAGDERSGVSLMQMDAGLDTGGVLLERAIAIAPGDTAASLHDKLALLGADAIVDALPRIERGELIATPQPAAGVSYAAKIDKREAALDFTGPAVELARRIRAFDPQPGCTATVRGVALKVFRAHASEGISAEPAHRPGEIVEVRDDGVMVATGAGLLKIGELQKSGGRRLPSGQFLRGFPLAAGECFALP